MNTNILIALLVASSIIGHSASVFQGRITAALTRGGQTTPLFYTVGTNCLRVESTDANRPTPVDILDRQSGEITLLFPHNRSFLRLKTAQVNSSPSQGFPGSPGGFPAAPGHLNPPPGAGLPPNLPPPQPPPGFPAVSGPANLPGIPAPPAMPQMPAMPNMPAGGGMPPMPPAGGMSGMPAMPMMMPGMMEQIELNATGQKTNILGCDCEKFEIKQRGEVMDIWATTQLFPFQNYVRNQPMRFGPRMIEEQWAGLLTARKLFPLLAILHFENGAERYRFEVQSVTPQPLKDEDQKLFQSPPGWMEIEPLPF